MTKLLKGTRVTLVDPNYKMRTTGTLVSDAFSGVYGTYTLNAEGNERFRGEGVLEAAHPFHYTPVSERGAP